MNADRTDQRGLGSQEAARRRAEVGSNTVPGTPCREPPPTIWRRLLSTYEARGRVGRNLALHIAVLVGLAVVLVIAAALAGQHALTWILRRTAIQRSAPSTRGLLA